VLRFRKNGSGRLPRKPEEIRRAVEIALTNVVVTLLLDKEPFFKTLSRKPAKILPWSRMRGPSKVQTVMEAMLRKEGYSILTLNLNLSLSLAKTMRVPIDLNYIGDETRRAIKSVLGTKEIYFFLVKESHRKDRTHFHGALLIPDDMVSDKLRAKLEQEISNSPPCRKYEECFGNKTVVIRSHYKKNKDPPGTKRHIDSGWGTYVTKKYNTGKKHVISKEASRLGKEFTETIREEECRLLSDDEYKKLSRRSLAPLQKRIRIVDYEEMSSKI
jgi:hypothetical protein